MDLGEPEHVKEEETEQDEQVPDKVEGKESKITLEDTINRARALKERQTSEQNREDFERFKKKISRPPSGHRFYKKEPEQPQENEDIPYKCSNCGQIWRDDNPICPDCHDLALNPDTISPGELGLKKPQDGE